MKEEPNQPPHKLRGFAPPCLTDAVRRKMRFVVAILLVGSLGSCRKQAENVGYWSGVSYETVRIQVLDEEKGSPVVGARVWLLTADAAAAYEYFLRSPANFEIANGAIERFGSRGFTSRQGDVSMTTPFSASGGIKTDGAKTSFRTISGYLIVEDSAYQRVQAKIEDIAPKNLRETDPIFLIVRVKKANQ